MYEKLEIICAILGITLTVILFSLSNQIKNIQDSIDSRVFNGALFISKNDLLMTLSNNRIGVTLSPNFLRGAYERYFQEVNNRIPTEQEMAKINTLQDYIKNIQYATSTTADLGRANQITQQLYIKRSNYQTWETRLFIVLVVSQFFTLYFSMKKSTSKDV